MQTKMLNKKLLASVKKLSPEAKLILCEQMFDCCLEKDNHGQYLVYTGYVKDRKRAHDMETSPRLMRENFIELAKEFNLEWIE